MACNKIDDLEDIASNLFDFDEEQPRPVRKEKALKKQRKPKTNHESTEKEEEQIEHIIVEKAPGTHNIFVKTFGCSHNISDSEFMVGQLVEYGYTIVDNISDADLVLINSCTVVNPSQDAFIAMVVKAKKIKKPLVVAGCVPQGDTTIPELAQVSAVGVTQIDRIVEVVEETLKGHKIQLLSKKQLPSLDLPKIRKNKDIEIIAINAGCLGACTYCKTVFARGKLISYQPQAIVNRVRAVAMEGVKEIWLTSQDTGAYGRDIGSNISELLIALCEQLQNHKGVMMRIGMTNPPYMLDQLSSIAHFLNHPRVFSFIHVPVQAGSNSVLQKMNRQYTVQEFKQVADYFLENVPEVTIATDIICGFAEETDEQFEESLELVNHYKFRVVNINQFYLRPGTPAANLKQLQTKVIKNRSSRLTQLFKSFDKHSYLVGRVERVWINETETHKGQTLLVGHTKNYTKVIIPYRQELLYKEVMMKITQAFDWHVQGEIVDENPPYLQIDSSYVQKMKQDVLEERQKIKSRKQAKLLKVREKKQRLIEQRLKREDKNKKQVYSVEVKNGEKKQVKQCCSGDCSCSKQGKSCQEGCCSKKEVNLRFIDSKLVVQASSGQKEQKITLKKSQKAPSIFLVLALVCFLMGVGLLFWEQ